MRTAKHDERILFGGNFFHPGDESVVEGVGNVRKDHTDGVGSNPAWLELQGDRIQRVHDRPDPLAGAYQPLRLKFLIRKSNGLKIDF